MTAAGPGRPIGVFDSGVGGLTVVSAVLSRLPRERIVYLGDTARVPYGTRSAQTVLKYSRNAARFLLRHDVKLLLIACNTASAAALPGLCSELPVGVLGAVEPGAASAAAVTRSGEVGVLGTLATIRSGAYERALLALIPSLKIHAQPCPLLVPLAKTFDFVATAAPGVKEILTVGKLAYEVREENYDLVVVDASATGHVVGLPQVQRAG